MTRMLAGVLLAILAAAPARASEAEDLREFGVESKRGTGSAMEQAGKAEALDAKYGRAKARVAEALGEAPEEEAPEAETKPESGRDYVRLRNGRELEGVTVVEASGKGYWVEVEGGRLFIGKAEVAELRKG